MTFLIFLPLRFMDTVGSKILLHPNTTPSGSLSHPFGVYDKSSLGGSLEVLYIILINEF
jgi:hypothetical protein